MCKAYWLLAETNPKKICKHIFWVCLLTILENTKYRENNFISFNKYLLSTYHLMGNGLDIVDTTVNQMNQFLPSCHSEYYDDTSMTSSALAKR